MDLSAIIKERRGTLGISQLDLAEMTFASNNNPPENPYFDTANRNV